METGLGFSVTDYFGIPVTELIRIAVKCGFSAVSPTYSRHIAEDCAAARECGAEIQFLHAPIGKAADMWSKCDERRKIALDEHIKALECAAHYEIPAIVAHTWIGFDNDHTPTTEGLDAHSVLVRRAEELGVKIAYENTEGIETLFALMERFAGCDTVGFCWDSGHELCYNNGDDLLALLGDRLLVTHLDDNLGVTDPAGKTKCTDDYHLLPFDGKVDWARAVKNLKKARKQDFLNFELKFKACSVADSLYASLSVEDYVCEAYKRADGILKSVYLNLGK
ncbi:MAG: sugar phosphate isomerase/epimerase [Clostridia bacterium]|nr:sugar phosphate isomerase/epimerase [Clostridia bacterium]